MMSLSQSTNKVYQWAAILGGLSALAFTTSSDLPKLLEQLTVRVTNSPSMVTPKVNHQQIVGIYNGRFEVTANANEQTIRDRVRYYRARGFNTIVQGVWGNGCAMYESDVTQKLLGQSSCRNNFNPQWLDWMLDEAKKQGMQVHAYFETGIKITRDSQIYDLANQRRWLLPGVDRSDPLRDRYVLDVANPEVVNLFQSILTEFVRKYPQIDAIQWDDYLAYSITLPGGNSQTIQRDRTEKLTKFVNDLIEKTKQANPSVSFDLANFNSSWAKSKYGADWQRWNLDRKCIEAYVDRSFHQDLNHAKTESGIAIGENQLHRLPLLIDNPKIKMLLIFPLKSTPKSAADRFAEKLNVSTTVAQIPVHK